MAGNYHTFKLVDGYALNATDGYSFTTAWVDCHSTPFVSVTAVFTGGSPAGTLTLQQSNDRQSTASNGIYPASALPQSANGTPLDAVNVPADTIGQGSASVSGAGAYALNQPLFCSRWFRLVYTASGNANTTFDVFVHLKRN